MIFLQCFFKLFASYASDASSKHDSIAKWIKSQVAQRNLIDFHQWNLSGNRNRVAQLK